MAHGPPSCLPDVQGLEERHSFRVLTMQQTPTSWGPPGYNVMSSLPSTRLYIYIYTANAWALPGPAITTGDASSSSSTSSSSSPSLELNPY